MGSNYDDGTAGVINPLSKQVLAEPSLLAGEKIGKRPKSLLAPPNFSSPRLRRINQRVDRFLQHPLFVTHNNLGSSQLKQLAQTIVAVDHRPIEIVQVARGKTTSLQLNHWPQVRRNHRQNRQDEPSRLNFRVFEALHNPQSPPGPDPPLPPTLVNNLAQLDRDIAQIYQ